MKSVINFFDLKMPTTSSGCTLFNLKTLPYFVWNCQWFPKSKNKKGIISDYLPWILIAVAVLAIILIFTGVLKDSGISAIDRLKDMFKIGGS